MNNKGDNTMNNKGDNVMNNKGDKVTQEGNNNVDMISIPTEQYGYFLMVEVQLMLLKKLLRSKGTFNTDEWF